MDRKQELKREYKEADKEACVYRIRNKIYNKVFIKSCRDKKSTNSQEFTLKMGTHMNKELQKDWNEYGKDSFVFEVLEKLVRKDEGYFDEKDSLKALEKKWVQNLQPFGDKGYN